MEKKSELCLGCMSSLPQGATKCPECGYIVGAKNAPDTLPSATMIDGRYLIGRVLRRSDLTVYYIGYDTQEERRVTVEEYFPQRIVPRYEGSAALCIPAAERTRFRTQFSDISDLWKRIARIESRSILPVYDVVNENETVYCISQFRKCTPLCVLMADGRTIPWDEARSHILPLFTVVARLHNAGLLHGGISPENVSMDEKGGILLSGFSLPEMHTRGVDNHAQIYDGFSAPEQYSRAGWQGEWTDIYSLGALLYRLLTGVTPPAANIRAESDAMVPPKALLPSLPGNVSAAILRAMSLEKSGRFASVNQFTAALLEETGSNTAVFKPAHPSVAKTSAKKRWRPSTVLILAVLLAASLIINAVQLSGRNVSPSSMESASGSDPLLDRSMPYQFIGMYLPVLQENLELYEGVTLKYLHGEHDEVPKNVVYDQSVQYGQELPEDRVVTLYVSDGPSYVLLPDLRGYTIDFARDKLENELNVFFEVRYVSDDTIEGKNNTVIAMSKEPGSRLNTRTSENPDTVTLTVKTTDVVSGN